MDRKYRELNALHKIPGFKIFDAVYADGIVTTNQELIVNNEQRISQVKYTYYNILIHLIIILIIYHIVCILCFFDYKFN